ncbi:MAG TPA: hypothetical protein VNL91_03115, partial [Thermoanaerobaculia bacterium]|nr:hypothetical protein [Thermoanaerobaculia bacterium]
MGRKRKLSMVILVAMLAIAAGACRSRARQVGPRVDPELANLTKEQAFAKAEELFNRKRYQRARTYYSHVYENHPNDPLGRRSLLRVADTYYEQGDPISLVEAQYKY